MSSDLAISVRELGKTFQVATTQHRPTTLGELLMQKLKNPFGSSQPTHQFEALQDVSFEVKKGEVLGIVGRNGAGKSTLLKILSRITPPTRGEIDIYGRVGALLEVGTGFHPELTGRENIYLNGTILGMRKTEIQKRFDEIVAFSEVEDFLDTPVKRYSSGMYVRLAFAVAAHLEPEILIVDEVLAVGDASFQKKCLGKMGDVAKGGRTVLFVSHNMTAVQSLCQRAIMLSNGGLVADGGSGAVVERYLKEGQDSSGESYWADCEAAPGTEILRLNSVKVLAEGGGVGDLLTMQTPLLVETEYWILKSGVTTHLTYHLLNDQGIVVLTTFSHPEKKKAGHFKARFTIPGNLLNSGGYSLKLLIVENENRVTWQQEVINFSIQDVVERKIAWVGREPGVVQPPLSWTITPSEET